MALIQIRSVDNEVSIVVDGTDITEHVLADPRPAVQVAPAGESGQSTVTLTLVGDVDLTVDGVVERSA